MKKYIILSFLIVIGIFVTAQNPPTSNNINSNPNGRTIIKYKRLGTTLYIMPYVDYDLTGSESLLFSEYKFEEVSGVSVLDSENSNDGTIINSATRVTGISGNAVQFMGFGHISLGNVFEDVNQLTLSVWVKSDSIIGTTQGVIMHGGQNIDTYALYVEPDSESVTFKTTGTTSPTLTVTGISELWDGNWHNLAVSYNGSKKVIYLDAVTIAEANATGQIESGEGYNLLIAAGRDDAIPTLLFKGVIDETRIYNYALDSLAIVDLYNDVASIGDATDPIVTNFTIPDTSFTYQVEITNLTATDNVWVTGYTITQSATAPLPSAVGWTSYVPSHFTVSEDSTNILYAWAKDAAGNVSLSKKDTTFVSVSVNNYPINYNGDVYYVSETGSDLNDGLTENTPWQTISKVNSESFSVGDAVLFKSTDEFEGTITPAYSGSSGSPITYGAYGQITSKPKIYGSEVVTGWTLHSGNIYKATVDETDIKQLFLDTTRMLLARYPNTGYLDITTVNNTTTFTSTYLNNGIDYTGATWIGRTSQYTIFAKTVTGSSSQTLTLNAAPSYSLGVGEGFFLTDKFDFLDQAGEWYYDNAANLLYFWTPTGVTPANYEVRISTQNYGFNIANQSYITVQDIDISHSAVTAVYVDASDYVTIDNCDITSPDLIGVHAPASSSSNLTVTNSNIYQANSAGIRSYSTAATFTDNTIEETGLLANINKTTNATSDNFGTAIFIRASTGSIVQYNKIINAGYCGINFTGTNSSIKYNHIDGANVTVDDGGGIYTYNSSAPTATSGSEVMYNIVENVHGTNEGYTSTYGAAYGIYMDNGTTDVHVMNNTVFNSSSAFYTHENDSILFQYNTSFDVLCGIRATAELTNSYFYDNIFYATNRNGSFTWWTNSRQRIVVNDGGSPVYDRNQYIDPYYTLVFRSGSDMTFADWKTATSQDANSTFDGTALAVGETEDIFYNDTKLEQEYNLNGATARDIDGNTIVTSFTLQPFTSKIVVGTDLNLIGIGAPVVSVPSISNITTSNETETGFTANATVNPNGAETTVYIQYGLTTAYGSTHNTVTGSPLSVTGSISAVISGLSVNTYHFRVVAINSIDTTFSADQTIVLQSASTLNAKSVAWYDFEETSGTSLVDAKGSFNGIVGDSVTINQTATHGKAHLFSGNVSGFYDLVPDNASFTFGNSFAISGWFNILNRTVANRIVSKVAEYYVEVTNTGRLLLRVYNGGTTSVYHGFQTGTGVIQDSTDYHIVVNVIDAANKQFELIINGIPITISDLSSGTFTAIGNTTNVLTIGGGVGSANKTKGYIGQIILFNESLTTDEKAALYDTGTGIYYTDL